MDDIQPENIKSETIDRPPVGTLVDFVEGVDENNPLDIEIGVNNEGRVVVFHDKRFKKELSWFEYEISSSKLDFILDDGQIRDAGMKIAPQISKHMQNSYQILTVFMDNNTGEAIEGRYVPLIIHRI